MSTVSKTGIKSDFSKFQIPSIFCNNLKAYGLSLPYELFRLQLCLHSVSSAEHLNLIWLMGLTSDLRNGAASAPGDGVRLANDSEHLHICGRGRGGHGPEVRGHVCSSSAMSVAFGLSGVSNRGGGKGKVAGGTVEEEKKGDGNGTRSQSTHDACTEMRESVGVGEKMEVTATIP